MKRYFALFSAVLMVLSVVGAPLAAKAERDLFDRAPWTASAGLGYMSFEGDEEVENGMFLSLKGGYDFNPHWAVELGLDYMPKLNAREFNQEFFENRYELEDDIWGARLGVDVLYHLRSTKNLHFDPYLSLGGSLFLWEESLGAGTSEPALTGGGGMFYHFDDQWGIRFDVRTMLASEETEGRVIGMIGASWRGAAAVDPQYAVTGGEIDSDNDGLLDSDEVDIGTDPYDPDTDGDGLQDGEEVDSYKTDPLNPDTDWDALKDGAEALTYSTDPLNRDTDNGGVADGHEVIEDHTDPLDPSDDLQLYTLNIEFDYDKADLRPNYFEELDVIVKVLQRDPGATARVEGHADKRPESDAEYNLHLSERRAESVVNYLAEVGGIERSRLSHKGYGFERPVAPNDTEENMQKNRRTEIYIRPSDGQEIDTGENFEVDAPVEEPAETEMPEETAEDIPATDTIK
jgi:outer membrane protein OmpA-like peptidoglycan-associated protein